MSSRTNPTYQEKKDNAALRKAAFKSGLLIKDLSNKVGGTQKYGKFSISHWLAGDLTFVGHKLNRLKEALPGWEQYHDSPT